MIITLHRHTFTDNSTIGIVRAEGYIACSLEDKDRQVELDALRKVPGKTCIPRGQYEVVISWSNRFQNYMMELLGIEGFSGVRIHAGNTHHNSEGCILLGEYQDNDTIVNSRPKVRELFEIVETKLKTKKVFIKID